MSDLFYKIVRAVGRPIVFGAARRIVLHEERARLTGGCLLAANHHSYFDSMVLVGTTTRMIDWVSIVELFRGPWQRRFMQGINCLALDRSRRDSTTTREIVRRLRAGRIAGLFPEARLRQGQDSILYGGEFTSGVVRLSEMSHVPVIPVIVLGAGQFMQPSSWIPGSRTALMVNYGVPIHFQHDLPKAEARLAMESALRTAFPALFAEIQAHPFWQQYAKGTWWQENYPD